MTTNSTSQWIVPESTFDLEDDPVDETPFTAEELRQLARAAGFRVLEGCDSSMTDSAATEQ